MNGLYRYLAVMVVVMVIVAGVGLKPTHPAAASPLAAQARPALSGDERTYGTDHFLIHYTFVGVDAVPSLDRDSSGTPDWIEDVGRAMETIRRVEVDHLGWPAPLPDHGEGGDTRFDVYMMELFSKGLAGYVSPDGGFVGDNPNTVRHEQSAAYGFLVLDNDFIDPNPPAGLKVWPPSDWMRIVAAHEFNHMLQISITGTHAMQWWFESTANWMETEVFPNLPDNLLSAGAVFKSPDTCLLRYGGVNRVESGLHWYGMWVFDEMLAEEYGPGIILDIWLRMGDSAGYAAFDDAFAAHGTTFADEVERFAEDVLLRDFNDGSAFPVARLQESVTGPGEWSPADGVQRYAMDYIGLNITSGLYTVTLDSPDNGVTGIVVGVRGSTADVFPAGRETTVDFDAYDHVYLIVVNLTRPPNEAGCATARYTYAVQNATDSVSAIDHDVRAATFSAPRVEAVTDPADVPMHSPFIQTQYDIRSEIRQVALPFQPITPRGAPSGYELDSVYGVNADEVGGDFVAMNAPSGGTVAQMLYYNKDGQLIRITESPTIYVTIGEWLATNNLESQPGTQIWTTGNVDAAIVSPSGAADGPYLVAFIVREKFMVIDGDADLDAMLDMAARFARS
jgi:hypothetical protein